MNKLSNNTLIRLVTAMQDGEYHDGNALGEQLGITRSAVWKIIKRLESFGVEISSVKGRGYALCEPLILLEREAITEQLTCEDYELEIFESIDSTNDYLRSLPVSNHVQYCLAEQQSKGRGRLNRHWHSPFAKNIYLSCKYPFQKDLSELSGLSLVASLAIVSALHMMNVKEGVQVKWPNDVLLDNKKLAGVLVEVQAESHGSCQAVVGMGVNVNMLLDADKDIDQDWTCLRKVIGRYIDRNDLCALIMNKVNKYFTEFNQYGLAKFRDEWHSVNSMQGKTVTLNHVNQQVQGEVQGINAQGHLILKMADGSERTFASGDTSFH